MTSYEYNRCFQPLVPVDLAASLPLVIYMYNILVEHSLVRMTATFPSQSKRADHAQDNICLLHSHKCCLAVFYQTWS